MARSKRIRSSSPPYYALKLIHTDRTHPKHGMRQAVPIRRKGSKREGDDLVGVSPRRSPPPPRARRSVPMTDDDVNQHEVMQRLAAERLPLPPRAQIKVGDFVVRTRQSSADGTFGIKVLHGPWLTRGHASRTAAWKRLAHIVENDVYDVVRAR